MAGEVTINLIGHVGNDPEIKFTPSGNGVCNVSVATTERVKDGDTWKDGETTWFRVAVWGRDAEGVAEVVRKGDRVAVSGRFKITTYEKDGQTKTSPEVTVSNREDYLAVIPKALVKQTTQTDGSPW